MPSTARKKREAHSTHEPHRRHLRAIKGGKTGENTRSAIDELFSGKVTQQKPKARGKKEPPPIELPKQLQKYSDVFAAGKALQREINLKTDFARQQLDQYCLADIARQYATINRRPASRNFSAGHSRFKFVFTQRTTLTQDKVEELRDMGVDVEEYTEVRGINIDYDAIREHKLENKLREAMEQLSVSEAVLKEVFVPRVQPKDSFYDVFPEVIRSSLREGEDLEEKILQALEILDPATQIRNVETIGLTPKQTFELVNETEIQTEDKIA